MNAGRRLPALSRASRTAAALWLLTFALHVLAAANKAPTVSIASPGSGASFAAPATLAITATAADADGTVVRVDFYQGTTLLGSRTVAPFAFTWSGVAAGSYSLTAKATDNAGASKTSAAVSITVAQPSITIASPGAGAAITGLAVGVAGAFSGDPGSTVVVDGPFGSRIATNTGNTYTAVVDLVPGVNTLRASVARRNGTSESTTSTVIASPAPLLTFTAPNPAASVFDTQTPVTLIVDALSPVGSIAKVDFFRNGALLGTAAVAPYRYTWTNPAAGSHTMSAVATDDRGVTGSATLPIVVKGPNAAPTVTMTSPTPGAAYVAPASIAIAAVAGDSDGAVVRVDFLRDSVVVGSTNVAPYAMTLPGVTAGAYALAVRATDDRGAATTSAPVGVVVTAANVPPSVRLVAPADNARFHAPAAIALSVIATDADGSVARVDYLAGGSVVASAVVPPFPANWSNVAPGTYALTARAIDNAGASAQSAPVTVVVDANSPPTITLASPVSGARYFAPADIALAATASDSDGTVTGVAFLANGANVATVSAPPYATTWRQVPAGNYTVTARAVDDAGAASLSSPVTVSVAATSVSIESPTDGASIPGDHVHVQGTIDAPPGAGVVVNGVLAAVDGNRFYAANVPLVPGVNVLAATLTTAEGGVSTRSVAVTGIASSGATITVSPTQGLAPLTVQIEVGPPPGDSIAKVEVDADGDGTFDGVITSAPWSTSVEYLSWGTVSLVVRVTDTAGNVVTERVPVVALDRAVVDARVRGVWNGMTAALRAGDSAKALGYLDYAARQRYGPVFATLQASLPAIVDSFSPLQGLSLTDDFGEYAINRAIDGQNRIFLLYFGRNGDGVWRLGSM